LYQKPLSGNLSARYQGPTPQISTQWRIALSMSRTTKPICRSGPKKRLISVPSSLVESVPVRRRIRGAATVA
jgi:hypothetical protein